MALQRQNPYLNEIIEVLDLHLQKHGGDHAKAREYLSKDDNQWIDDEILHCMTDTRYFLSNFYAIKTEDRGFTGLYPFWDSQELLYEEFEKRRKSTGKVRAIVDKARQMGGSTFVGGYIFANTIFSEHINTIVVAQDSDQSTYILDMYSAAIDELPWWMRPRIRYKEKGKFIDFDEKDDMIRYTRPGLKTRLYADNGNKPTGAGRGKCQTPWTYVWTEEGPITLEGVFDKYCDSSKAVQSSDGIGEWYPLEQDLYTFAFNGKELERRKVSKVFRQKYIGPIEKIDVANGVSIEKTPQHRVLSGRKWKESITTSDYVDVIDRLPWTGTEEVSPEFAELLAWHIAEGCDGICNAVQITQKDDEVRYRIAGLAEVVTGRVQLNRNGADLKDRCGYVSVSSREYRKHLEEQGYIWGSRSAKKIIPRCVFRWKKELAAIFLRAFFEAEGSVGDKVEIVSASKHVAESLRMLCAAFGVSLRIRPCIKYAANTKKKTRRTYYRGSVSGPSMVQFAKEIGFLSNRKQDALMALVANSNGHTLRLLPRVTQMLRDACREAGAPFKKILGTARAASTQDLSLSEARAALGRLEAIAEKLPTMYPSGIHHAYRKCNQSILKVWAERIRPELESELSEERVDSVSQYDYEGYIYDLEVEDTHNYPTCGVVTHNTFNRAHLDELAFWSDPTQLTKALFPTMNAADGIYVMISTPNGRNDAWHNLWRKAEAGDNDWYPIYIPFYRREKTYSLPIPKGTEFKLTEEEKLIREQVHKKEHYLIKDEVFNWRRKRIQDFIAIDGDEKMFHQEFSMNAEESFQTSAVTAYPLGIINKLMKRVRNPLWVGEISYDFDAGRPVTRVRNVEPDEDLEYPKSHNRLHIWEKPEAGASYCVGVDVSLGNDGGDYSCCQVLKTSELTMDRQVACWHGYIDPESLAEIVLALCWMYNEALAAVEVNSMGMVTNNRLVRQFEYENIYRYKHLDKLTHWMTDIIGFWTNDKTKRALMSKMSKTLLDDSIDIPDKFTVDEFYDFTEDGAEGDGAHDDYLMALHIAHYCAHENEYREMREGTKKQESTKQQNEFKVMDRFGTIIQTTSSQNEAERVSKKNIGSSIVRTAGATATVNLKGLGKRRVPSDFQNSDWSPVHDGNGTAARMYEDGIEPEEITPEAIQAYEAGESEADVDDENSWLYQ